LTFDHDVFEEHGVRADPPAKICVKRAVDNQRFKRLAMSRYGDDLVLASFVVAIVTEWRVWQGRQVAHGWDGSPVDRPILPRATVLWLRMARANAKLERREDAS